MDFIANATGAIYAEELDAAAAEAWSRGQTDAPRRSSKPSRRSTRSELSRDGPRTQRRKHGARHAAHAHRRAEPRRRGPRIGARDGRVGRLAVRRSRPSSMYGVFVLWPLVPDRSVFAVRLERHRPVAAGSGWTTTDASSPIPSLLSDHRQRVRADRCSSAVIPVVLGLVVATVIRRVTTRRARHVGADGPVPAPGHPAGRGRHRVELDAVVERPGQPGAVAPSASAASTRAWLGDFDFALPAVGIIGAWVLLGLCTDAAARRHEQDRPGALRGGPARRRRRRSASSSRSRCPACARRSASASRSR